jgi:hypothetical protein
MNYASHWEEFHFLGWFATPITGGGPQYIPIHHPVALPPGRPLESPA